MFHEDSDARVAALQRELEESRRRASDLLRENAELRRQADALQDVAEALQAQTLKLGEQTALLRRQERALEESESKYRFLLEESLAAVYVIQDGRLAYANPRMAEILGYTLQELHGMSLIDIALPERRAQVEENVRRRLQGEVRSLRYDTKARHKSGAVRDIEVFGSVTSYNGAPAIIGTLLDRTEERRALEALRSSEAKYRMLMEQATDGVAILDEEYRILEVNSNLCAMLGYSHEELIGRCVQTLVVAGDFEAVPLLRFDELRRSGSQCLERRCVRKDGTVVDVEVQASPLENRRVLASLRDLTKRRRTEEALRQSEARFHRFMDNSPCVAFIKDAQGKYLYVNRFFRERLLRPGDDVVGKTPFDVYPDPLARKLIEHDQTVLRTGRTLEMVETVVDANGALREWLTFKFPIDDDAGGTLAAGVGVEITERLRAERALSEQTRILQSILDSMGDGVAVVDRDGKFLIFNPAAQRICGRGPVGRPEEWTRLYGIFKPDGVTPCPTEDIPLVRAMRGEMVDDAELLLRREGIPDGVWLSLTGRALRDENGELRGGVLVFRDVTQRRHILEELRRAEAKYRALVERLPVVTYAAKWEPIGATLYISPQIESKLGYAPEEWIRDPGLWLGRVHPEDRERSIAQMRHCRDTGEPFLCEYRMLARDGRVVWFHDEGVVIRDEDRRAEFLQGVMIDITAQEEAQLGRQRMEALSRDLVSVQEAERQRIAKELHDEIGQTLALLKLELEKLEALDPEQDPGSELRARLLHAGQLVQELTSRVRQMSVDLRPAVLEDLGLLPALLWSFDRFTKSAGIEVRFEHRGIERRLQHDVEVAAFRMVQEALTNVMRHARGVREIEVQVASDGQRLTVQVRDCGPGFEPAAVLAMRDSRGLTNMRERLALLGGRLEIDSAPGRGCRLSGELPLYEVAGRAADRQRPARRSVREGPGRARSAGRDAGAKRASARGKGGVGRGPAEGRGAPADTPSGRAPENIPGRPGPGTPPRSS